LPCLIHGAIWRLISTLYVVSTRDRSQEIVVSTAFDRGLLLRRLALVFATISAAMLVWFAFAMPTTLTVAVGPSSSQQYRFAQSMVRALKDTRQPFRLRIVTVEGSQAASRALDSSRADLAVVRSDDLSSTEARSLVVIQRRSVVIVSPKDGGITAFPDLKGKRVGLVASGGDSNRQVVDRLLEHHEMGHADLHLSELDPGRAAAAMAGGALDALILVSHPASGTARRIISELSGQRGVAVSTAGIAAPEALALRFREFEKSTVPAGVYGGSPQRPPEDVETVAISYELVASSRLSDAKATSLTAALVEVRARLRRDNQRTSYDVETPPVDVARRFLPHAGTAAYINDEEAKTFLDTYSDQIWLTLFLLSLIGSSVMGFLSWVWVNRSPESRNLPGQLRALARRLDSATTLAEVDAIRSELDRFMLIVVTELGRRPLPSVDGADPTAWLSMLAGLIDRRRAEIAARSAAHPAHVALAPGKVAGRLG
jgi:TRAP transporter TAXI family solute receptor